MPINSLSTNPNIINNKNNQPISLNQVNYSVVASPNNINPNNAAFSGISNIPFSSYFSKTQTPQKIYKELYNSLDNEGKVRIESLLKTGKLFSRDSTDGSTTLQNLYKIITEPRVRGLNSKKILDEAVKTLANPYIITQDFSEIPGPLIGSIIENEKQSNPAVGKLLTPDDLNMKETNSCVAASIEFNLADKRPSEFARYAASLTSPDLCVKTKAKYEDIADINLLEAVNWLNQYKVENKSLDWNTVEFTLRPDREAIIRARVQNTYQNPGTKSSIDVLMQSTFMQVGSCNDYNSLIDKNNKDFIKNNKKEKFDSDENEPSDDGISFEAQDFINTIVDSKTKKVTLIYHDFDDNNYLNKDKICDYETVKKHLLDTLKTGSNVIIGIDKIENNKFMMGHEIVITGTKLDKNNELYFTCFGIHPSTGETFDLSSVLFLDNPGHALVKAEELIPKIHHASIPIKILDTEDPTKAAFSIFDHISK
ncbi:MAG: hypothetical protein V2B14_05600 [bacterium]